MSGQAVPQIQLYDIERFRFKMLDPLFPFRQHGQRRGHDPPDMQGGTVQKGIEPRRVHPNQPVRLSPAEGCLIQMIVGGHGFQVFKAFQDRAFFHGGNPQALDGLSAAGHLVYVAEDQLALAPGVRRAHDAGDPFVVHERADDVKLFLAFLGNDILPLAGDDRKILVTPMDILLFVVFRKRQLHQMPDTPGDDHLAALKKAFLCFSNAQRGGDCPAYAGFFSNNQFHTVPPSERLRGPCSAEPVGLFFALIAFFGIVVIFQVEIGIPSRSICVPLVLQENEGANSAQSQQADQSDHGACLVFLRRFLGRRRGRDGDSGWNRRYVDDLRGGRWDFFLFFVRHQRKKITLVHQVQEVGFIDFGFFVDGLVIVDDKIEGISVLGLHRDKLFVGGGGVQDVQGVGIPVRLEGHARPDGNVFLLDDGLRGGRCGRNGGGGNGDLGEFVV